VWNTLTKPNENLSTHINVAMKMLNTYSFKIHSFLMALQ